MITQEALNERIAQKLQSLFDEWGWHQREAARQLEVSQAKISKTLTAETAITTWMLYLLAEQRRVSPIWLLLDRGGQYIEQTGWTVGELAEVVGTLPNEFLLQLATVLPDEVVFQLAAERATKR